MKKKCPNPQCGESHECHYYVDSSGKKILSVWCYRTEKFRADHTRYLTKARWPLEDNEQGLDAAEEWSVGWAKKKQLESTYQLPLMNS